MSASLSAGIAFSDYSGASGTLQTQNWMFQAEVDLFLLQQRLALFLDLGLGSGWNGKDEDQKPFEAWFLPITLGAKYRFVRPWLTPYAGLGVGVGVLQLSETGVQFNIKVLAGIELNPWKRFGFVVEGALILSQFFESGAQNFFQVGGRVTLGVVYRF